MIIPGSEPRARVAWAFLNDFNHAQFGLPSGQWTSPNFGFVSPRTRHASSKWPRSLFSSLMLRAVFNGCIRGVHAPTGHITPRS